MELGSHVWHLRHLAFDFWASLYHLFRALLLLGFSFLGISAFCFIWSVTPMKFWFSLVLLVWFECTDIWYKLLKLIWEFAHSKVPRSTWEPLGGKNFVVVFFLTGQSIAVIQWQEKGLKILYLYWQMTGKWAEVPLCPGIPPVINSLGLIKPRLLLPQRDNPCWDQSALVIMGQVEHYLV